MPPIDTPLDHETPLLRELRTHLKTTPHGRMSVHDYTRLCGASYYARGRVLGRAGDFVTAPEISQIFGELIGMWCAIVWQQMGSPRAFHLVELGPGRGTMLRDALRALRTVPACLTAAQVALIETSPALRAVQAETLAPWQDRLVWPGSLSELPDAPAVVLGNEYVDALPIRQLVWQDGWHERCVGLDDEGALTFVAGDAAPAERADMAIADVMRRLGATARSGDILEVRPLSSNLARLGQFAPHGLATLLIDYGHTSPALGDTLQAVRHHAFVPPLVTPGDADLSAQVDFEVLARQLAGLELAVSSCVNQATFLSSLGIVERASRLMQANPAEANAIEMAVGRLLSPTGMGTRFQVLGARAPALPPLPGLPT